MVKIFDRLIMSSIRIIPWRLRNCIKKIPVIKTVQHMLLKVVQNEEFIHTVDAGPAKGLKYPVQLPQDKGIWTGTYELEFAKLLSDAIRPGDVCFDVGGWRGFFTGVMAVSDASRVIVFEPLPDNCRQIEKVIELNPELPISLVEAAVGESDGSMDFVVMPQSSMGKLAISSFQECEQGQQQIQVRVVSLDQWVSSTGAAAPSVIKMDIEGAEYAALVGAQKLLSEHHPALFIEIHSRQLAKDCHALLLQHGYHVIVMETGKPPDGTTEPDVCHFVARSVQ